MSNLFSYFQRIEPKKMATTTATDESIRQANNTLKTNSNNNGTTKKNQTPKETSRKSMNMNDVYSSDSPKSEKRKQSLTIASDDHETLPKNKSKINISIRKSKIIL
jgi:arylamine N-acetyltransferase